MAVFTAALVISSEWEFGAKLVPQVVGWTAMLFLSTLVFVMLFYQREPRKAGTDPGQSGTAMEQTEDESDAHFDIVVDFGDLPIRDMWIRASTYFGWCLFFFGSAAVIGLLPAIFFFLVGYMRFSGKETWTTTLVIATSLWVFCYYLFHQVLIIPWPQTVIGDLFPVLRTMNDINLF